MSIGHVPICLSCERFRPSSGGLLDDAPASCSAFPAGIPDAIYVDGYDHRATYPGDGGVRWELRAGGGDDLVAYVTAVELHAG